jgi:hypothetical protein
MYTVYVVSWRIHSDTYTRRFMSHLKATNMLRYLTAVGRSDVTMTVETV